MLFPVIGLALGAVLGAAAARRRGGTAADMAQWGAVTALTLAVAGVVVTVVLGRMAG
ncbi:MAG: hypothetical protein IT542_05275 [Rubellimicrobium sp.]|nr:hypothetical protein [Rubellimicrobium sp.]